MYIQDVESSVVRPIKELKGFEKVSLEPNETKTVTFTLDKRSFAYYNVDIKDWHVETGKFNILIGKSSMGESTQEMMEQMLKYNPLRVFVSFTDGRISSEFIQENLDRLNNAD